MSMFGTLSYPVFYLTQPGDLSSYSNTSDSYSIHCNPLPHWMHHHPAWMFGFVLPLALERCHQSLGHDVNFSVFLWGVIFPVRHYLLWYHLLRETKSSPLFKVVSLFLTKLFIIKEESPHHRRVYLQPSFPTSLGHSKSLRIEKQEGTSTHSHLCGS